MTPVERIIMRFYAANTFMFDHEDERHYSSVTKNKVISNIKTAIREEQGINLSEEQIKAKYKYLRDIFVKADNLVEEKKNLTYLQKCVHQRMFFLKPFICATKKHNSLTEGGRYEMERNIKTKQTESDAYIEELQDLLNNSRKNVSNELVNILCKKIKAYKDIHTQRQVFKKILSSIRLFRENVSNKQ